jgi:hypothetical protein
MRTTGLCPRHNIKPRNHAAVVVGQDCIVPSLIILRSRGQDCPVVSNGAGDVAKTVGVGTGKHGGNATRLFDIHQLVSQNPETVEYQRGNGCEYIEIASHLPGRTEPYDRRGRVCMSRDPGAFGKCICRWHHIPTGENTYLGSSPPPRTAGCPRVPLWPRFLSTG